MLVVHVGLPKTGTTFLQHRVLAQAPGIVFVHRGGGPRQARACASFRHFAHASALTAPFHRRRLVTHLRALTGSGPLLVSDENISVKAAHFWTGGGTGPDRLARRLAGLAADLGPLRVILGIRRQDRWLASRYAESSRHFPSFGQHDFDRRMAEIAAAPALPGPLGWLDYQAVRAAFAAALGAENLLLVPLERLAAAPEATLDVIGGFLGIEVPHGKGQTRPGRRRNTLATGENSWRLRRDRTPLTLAPELQAAIRARFAASNRALAALTPLGFEP
jgi:hypothetical protein